VTVPGAQIQSQQTQGKAAAHLCGSADLKVDLAGREDLPKRHLVVLLQRDLDGERARIHFRFGGDIAQLALHIVFRHRGDPSRVRLCHLKLAHGVERRRVGHGLHFAPCRIGKRVIDGNRDGSGEDRQQQSKRDEDIAALGSSKSAPE
jgi:hypothetical protein